MANPSDSLGIPANFPSDLFRTGIRFAMQMGTPNLPTRAAVFIKPAGAPRYFRGTTEVQASSLKLDRDGVPLDSTVRVVRGTSSEVSVDVAIETFPVTEDETPVGQFKPLRAEVTVLDEDYAKIKDCRRMRYNGNLFAYFDEPDTFGLFDVDIHPIIFWAIDEGVSMTETTGGYVRHRDRMVQQSVFEDIRDTLIACRWFVGTTANPVYDVQDGTWGLVTTEVADLLPLLGQDDQGVARQINLIDYFPDSEGETGGVGTQSKIPLNTFALSNGEAGDPSPRELGSSAVVLPYTFSIAFFAASDALASAVLNDLRDRCGGRLVRWPEIDLFDYNTSDSEPVVRMDVESFSYRVNTEAVTSKDVHLYFGELVVIDDVD